MLPPMGSASTTETFFVVASTDMERAGVMTRRMREQIERVAGLKEKGTLAITVTPIQPSAEMRTGSIENQVQAVAQTVTEMVMRGMDAKHNSGNGKHSSSMTHHASRNKKGEYSMTKPKILVVDDDPDLVRALRLRLKANDYQIATASDGYTAIASAQKEKPDLIILDLGSARGRRLRRTGASAEQRRTRPEFQ